MRRCSADLPKPGTFFTCNDLGKPILCTRDRDGRFNAFVNVCRHRGTVVENEARGEKRLFSCPFHGWGYDSRGNLVAVPKEHQFGAVERACHGLVALPAEERYGLLWVHPDPAGGLDVDASLGGLGDEFASWRLDRAQFSGATRYQHPMNWKLAVDTFGETYHFNVLHETRWPPTSTATPRCTTATAATIA
jgi:phenylpropionate dioxygenase-like ring-hydroxylating dioxygenase large terminal subunit